MFRMDLKLRATCADPCRLHGRTTRRSRCVLKKRRRSPALARLRCFGRRGQKRPSSSRLMQGLESGAERSGGGGAAALCVFVTAGESMSRIRRSIQALTGCYPPTICPSQIKSQISDCRPSASSRIETQPTQPSQAPRLPETVSFSTAALAASSIRHGRSSLM